MPRGGRILTGFFLGLVTLITLFVSFAGCGTDAPPHHESDTPVSWVEPTQPDFQEGQFVPRSWIVAFRAPATREALKFATFRHEARFHQTALQQQFLSDPRVAGIDFITAADLSAPAIGTELRTHLLPAAIFGDSRDGGSDSGATDLPESVAAIARVDFVSDDVGREVLREWEASGRIWFADRNGLSQLSGIESQVSAAKNTLKKLSLFDEWALGYENFTSGSEYGHLSAIQIPAVMKAIADRDPTLTPTNDQILADPPIIAVIDSGVDYEHPQLKGQIFQNPSPGSTGCVDDVYGCNVAALGNGYLGNGDVYPHSLSGPGQPCNNDASKACSHGTHVAGLIAARYKPDGSGVSGPAGVCPFCKILIIKATGASGSISDASQLAGMKYVSLFRKQASNAVRVVNASFGQFQRNRAIAIIVASLRRTGNGTLVVAASGNEDTMLRSYPASLEDSLAVSAVDGSGNKTGFSNFGSWVDIAAPGLELKSTVPGPGPDSTDRKSGTSMAAPLVSGVAGLMMGINPSMSAKSVKDAIILSASPSIYSSESNTTNYRFYYARIAGETVPRPLLGSGLVQADAAIKGSKSGAYTATAVRRVTPGCARIGLDGRRLSTTSEDPLLAIAFAILMFVVPVWYLFRGARRWE